MKIALVAEGYPPMSGGVATSARRVSQELAALGHDVTVLTFDNTHDVLVPDLCISEQDNGVTVLHIGPFFLKNDKISPKIGMLTEKHKAMLRRRAFNQMLRILEKDCPDILLSFYLLNAGFMAQMLGNALDVPVVAGVRGNDIGRNIFDCERFSVIHWTVSHAAAVACVNHHLMRRLTIAFPEIKEKALVTKNGIDASIYDGMSTHRVDNRARLIRRMGWNDSDLILNFAGSLREKKGVITLLRALRRVNAERKHIRLMVTGPELGKAEYLMVGDIWDELKRDNIVRLSGQISRSAVPELISACDVACYPSNEDGMANGLLEAMAMGLPSIVTTIFDDVVTDGVEGLVIPYDDEDALVDAMERAYRERDVLNAMGDRAYQTIRRDFTAKAEAETYIALFEQVLGTYRDR